MRKKVKVLVVGAHPDDPECGCGGTIARLINSGHDVSLLYLTRGEAGILGKTNSEAAQIRTKEAQSACQVLKARPLFAGQIDGNTEVNAQRYSEIAQIIKEENSSLLFTHWPIDTHRDHRVASILTYDAWMRLKEKPELFYYEVLSGKQTQMFNPTDYVDITSTAERKREACLKHVSQNTKKWYNYFEAMQKFRGNHYQCELAEAFVRQDLSDYRLFKSLLNSQPSRI